MTTFTYKAYPKELIGKEVNASYLYGNRSWITSYGIIAKFLNNNRVRLVHSDNSCSVRVFRKEWGILAFVPEVGDTVYGSSTRSDPDCINERGNHSSQLYWKGTVEEIHDDHVIVKMSVTGRLSKRTSIRPRL